MQKILLLLCVISNYNAFAQILSPVGLFAAGEPDSTIYAQISWTLGDIQTETLIKNITLTQGFLQPNFIITKIDELPEEGNIIIDVFPNPVKDILNIRSSASINTDLFINLYSLDGKLLINKKVDALNNSEEIHFEPFQSGYYLLKIFSGDYGFIKTFKILFEK